MKDKYEILDWRHSPQGTHIQLLKNKKTIVAVHWSREYLLNKIKDKLERGEKLSVLDKIKIAFGFGYTYNNIEEQ